MELGRAPAWRRPLILLATGLGLGLAPVASGTFGTLPGLLIVLGLAPLWPYPPTGAALGAQALAAAILALLALPLCDTAEKHFGRKDDGRIVADEYLTFPIGLLGLPLTPGVLVLAFLTNRIFDVIKPFPARRLQDLPGGLGIVADDVVSACYSLLVNHGVYILLLRHLALPGQPA
jgi:phosphatidylglycerophosphatase A